MPRSAADEPEKRCPACGSLRKRELVEVSGMDKAGRWTGLEWCPHPFHDQATVEVFTTAIDPSGEKLEPVSHTPAEPPSGAQPETGKERMSERTKIEQSLAELVTTANVVIGSGNVGDGETPIKVDTQTVMVERAYFEELKERAAASRKVLREHGI